jgi:3-amino-4-hydroxybenzoate 4-O-methyltransferase
MTTDTPAETSAETPAATMVRLLTGSWVTQALHVAAALGIADLLAEGPADSARLAAATGAHEPSLRRLLRYLAALGVLEGDDGDDAGGFRLTPVGELLRTDVPGSVRERALTYGTWNYQALAELLHTMRTGQPAFEHRFGTNPYDYLTRHPEAARTFDRQMELMADFFAAVPEAYDFSDVDTVVDIAGGNGTLLATVLAAAPHARGILFDAPHVVQAARGPLADRGVLDRCALAGGDFLDTVPAGGDVYILSRILHNWDDERCLALLANCRTAMRSGATLLIVEHEVPEENPPASVLGIDINMLALFGGRERTAAEFGRLLDEAGFDLTGQHPLPFGHGLLTARRR